MRKTICLLAIALLLITEAGAQQPAKKEVKMDNELVIAGNAEGPVKYSIKAPRSMGLNDSGRITISFSFEEGWYGYAETDGNMAAGWLPTKVEFEFSDGFEKNGGLITPPIVFKEGTDVYIGNEVKFVQPVKYTGKGKDGKLAYQKERIIHVTVHYQTCDEEKCLPPVTDTVAVKINMRNY
ncbi:protein-disulfide reductase DsbD domain-containing protein [Pseudobacter ginsenosidimutans]|uniref:Disulfide bond corrector protein DsbC n=1 Tax=Pseudobacter ginsenosidimutans TaxID=661488 RepID=A0A4Q7MT08_9BACT|nr:protein-disulfide reductase DsbD domain-containing protein [Pseudobacter ginsenosidimutans]RZS71029.1 disulfide bond corrector protein DsbC [Pseudobacter ginsenosidimutans]